MVLGKSVNQRMNLLLMHGRVVVIIFAAMSLASTVFIATTAQNYLSFFPALQGVQAEVSSVTFQSNLPLQEQLSASVQIANSNDYSGISIGHVTLKLLFLSPNSTLFDGYLVGEKNVNAPLAPRAHLSMNVTSWVPMNPSVVSNLTSFIRKYPHVISVNSLLRVDLTTFLSPATGPTVILTDENVPLSVSPSP